MFFTKRWTLHLLFVLLLVSGRHCVDHWIDWNLSGVQAINHRVDVNLKDTVRLNCFNNQSTVTYFSSSSDFIGCVVNSNNTLERGHCGNAVIGGVVTLTIHGVSLPGNVPYAVNGSYNFTSVNNGECANGLWLTVRVVEHPPSITPITPTHTFTATLPTATLPTSTSSITSTTSLETSGTGATDNSMTDILVSAVKTTTSTDYATNTQRPTPTVGGKKEGNYNFFSSWPLGAQIGSLAGVIAVFSLACLVCLVGVGLVLYHSKKRRKEFKTGSPSPEESIRPLFYDDIDSKGGRVALDGTKETELTNNNMKTISSEQTSKENNSTESLEIKNSAYSKNVTNGHTVSSPSRPPPKPPTSGPLRPPPHKPTNSVKELKSLPASSKPLPASSKPTNTGPASLPAVRNSPKATATVTPPHKPTNSVKELTSLPASSKPSSKPTNTGPASLPAVRNSPKATVTATSLSVQYKSRRQAPAPPPSLNNKSNNKTKPPTNKPTNNALRSI